jgi:hypothetical protein
MNALPVLLFSDEALMRLVRLNAPLRNELVSPALRPWVRQVPT